MKNGKHETVHGHSLLRLMELAERNPSLGGRELTREILERDADERRNEQSSSLNLQAALRVTSLADPDYRTRAEQADWIGRESKLMRELYEQGAAIKGEILILPAEEHELPADREMPFITTLAYALRRIEDREKANEFHSLAKKISGQTADARTEIVVFKTYYDRIARSSNIASSGTSGLIQTMEEMRKLALEMERLETRKSIETIEEEKSSYHRVATTEAARKVRLDEERLRFPVGLSVELKERLIAVTIPEIDRRLESGIGRKLLFAAIDGGTNRKVNYEGKEFSEQERAERQQVGAFLKAYIEERLRDPETRALNTSKEFREARAEVINARTAESLGRVAESFLRQNQQRSDAWRRHHADPDHNSLPAAKPLDTQQRNLLFNGRAPEHHSVEMRDLRISYGLSRAERAQRIVELQEGLLSPSAPLRQLLKEFDARHTAKSVAHFQGSLLRVEMNDPEKPNLQILYSQIPPHEKTYLYELAEERKRNLGKNREEEPLAKFLSDAGERPIGTKPIESQSFREYVSQFKEIERNLLQDEAKKLGLTRSQEASAVEMSATAARQLLPKTLLNEIKSQARELAWNRIMPDEAYAQSSSPEEIIQIRKTITQLRDEIQPRAFLAQTARNEWMAAAATSNKSPEEAGKLAALNKYAIETREAFYRGFEQLDVEWRALEMRNREKEKRGFPDIESRFLPAYQEQSQPAEREYSFER